MTRTHLTEDAGPKPHKFVQSLVALDMESRFEQPEQLEQVWGQRWGASDEVGRLRAVLMRSPGEEFARIDASRYDASIEAAADPEGLWYWASPEAPDVGQLRRQHQGLVQALEEEDVAVHLLDSLGGRFSKAIYTRDPLVTVRGGAVMGRPAALMRRGEEADVTRAIATIGMPILGTVVGQGTLEGGSFAKLSPTAAVYGTTVRCNEEGARQLQALLANLGIELTIVPLTGFSLHLDGVFAMIDVDKALVDARGLPYWFPECLRGLGIEPIWIDPSERWAVNSLAVAPGRLVMSASAPRTAERLERKGLHVRLVEYDEIQKNGGGIHCSTMELLRDDA